MRETRTALTDRLAMLDRRQMLGAIGSGVMFGSAWAAVFRHLTQDDSTPVVTVAHSGSALAALVAYHGHRIMVLDAADGPGIDTVTGLVAGFAHRRIDTVLAPTAALAVLPTDYRERWRVRDAWTLPDHADPAGRGLVGRSLAVGDLTIATDSLPRGAWRSDPPDTTPWYLAATFGSARLAIASDAVALSRLPLDPQCVNGIVCVDPELELPTGRDGISLLAVPREVAKLNTTAGGPALATLYPDAPMALRLNRDAIELPSSV